MDSVLDVPIRGLGGQSFQSWLVRLPVREKGMGLISLVDIIPAAFIGSVEMSLPFFCREGGVCQLLLPTVGDTREAEVASRWQTLLDSGSRTGRELAECWDTLRGEAQECCDYLGEELEGPLASPVEGMGEGRLDGSTRYRVTQQREGLRAKVVSPALSEHHDQTARPVWVFPQFDQTSCVWLLATPSPETFIPSQLFREAMAAHLCPPFPLLSGPHREAYWVQGDSG